MVFVLLIIGYAAISALGLALMKAAPKMLSSGFAFGLVLYGAGFAVWLYILQKYPLSVAFPVAAGSLVIGTQLLAFFLLKESINLTHIAGVFLVIFGIAVLYGNGLAK